LAKQTKAKGAQRSGQVTTWPLYIVLVASFVLYIIYQSSSSLATIFGVIIFVVLIALIGLEVINGSRESGKLRNALEIIAAIVIVLVAWFAMKAILHTNYPIDAVPSCSMLPALQRGDLIVLQGTNASGIKAPQVQVTKSQVQNMLNNINGESLECVAYKISGNNLNISQVVLSGYSVGLFRQELNRGSIVSNQSGNLIQYSCGTVNLVYQNGTVQQEAYTKSIMIGNTTISGDHNNSIIVYQTVPQDSFYKDGDSYIVHRVYAVLNASGTYYYLTKGDNNPGLDMQYQNYPINQSYVEGKVIGTVPFLGYLKLILSGTLSQPAGCASTLQD
jgi:signal peptidase I